MLMIFVKASKISKVKSHRLYRTTGCPMAVIGWYVDADRKLTHL